MATPGHTRIPPCSSQRAPMVAPSPITQSCIRTFAPMVAPAAMMELRTTAPGSMVTPSKITESSMREPAPTMEPRPTTVPPTRITPPAIPADGSTRHSPVLPSSNGEYAMPRTRSEEPCTKSLGRPMSRQ